jgi:glycosyltransferase involved in cell wall biosynthesis
VNASHGGKILFVVNEAYFFMTHRIPVARALAVAGCEVHVAVPADHVWAPSDFSIDEIEEAGFILHTIPLSRRGKNILQDIQSLVSIYRLILRVKPDVVHLFTIKPVIYGGLVARFSGVKSLISSFTGLGHVFIAPGITNYLLKMAVVFLYRLATGHRNSRVIVQNSGDAQVLVGKGAVREKNVRLIPGSGVNIDKFPMKAEPEGPPLVILPSRLIWEKGIAEFVQAAKTLKEKGIVCRFALVGDTQVSNPRAVQESQIEEWVAEGVLEWWGRRTDMPDVFAQSSIVCLPTTYGEGLPRVLVEAAACGRAIVTTDIAACREVVQHNENGLLVPPGDTGMLIEALETLISAPDERARMGMRGREIVASRLTEDHIVRSTLDVYREITDIVSLDEQGPDTNPDKSE